MDATYEFSYDGQVLVPFWNFALRRRTLDLFNLRPIPAPQISPCCFLHDYLYTRWYSHLRHTRCESALLVIVSVAFSVCSLGLCSPQDPTFDL